MSDALANIGQLCGKRVAVDARYLQRSGVGITVYLQALLRALSDAGADLTLLVQRPVDSEGLEQCHQVVMPMMRFGGHFLWEQWVVMQHLWRTHYDVYLAPANWGIPLVARRSLRRVLILHDLIPLHGYLTNLRRSPVASIVFLVSTLISVWRSNVVITVSRFTQRDLRRRLARSGVAAPTPLSFTAGSIGSVGVQRLPYFVYNGGLGARKRVEDLLTGFQRFLERFPDYQLFLMGRGYEYFDPEVRNLGITHAVRNLGFVSEEDKYQIIRRATAVVYPSVLEGYGLPIVEALQCGTPIVCGTGGAQVEVAGRAGIYLSATGAAAVSEALERVVTQLPDDYGLRRDRQLAALADPSRLRRLLGVIAGGPTADMDGR